MVGNDCSPSGGERTSIDINVQALMDDVPNVEQCMTMIETKEYIGQTMYDDDRNRGMHWTYLSD